jgi:hypothetical protein
VNKVDVQRYISSGIIESYVVGLVSAAEAREVENAMAEFPEIKAAVEACRRDMERYVQLHSIPPPKGIRKRLLEVIENEDSLEGEALLPEELREPEPDEAPAGTGFSWPAISPERILQFALALAVVLLGISLFMNFRYASRYKIYKQKYDELVTVHQQATADNQLIQARLQQVQGELTLLKNPAFTWTRLNGNGKHAGQFITVCWNPASHEAFVLAQGLPEPAAGQQYQLWALVNGKAVDAGVFETGQLSSSPQKMKAIAAAQMFMVTLEKKGGNDTPSWNQVFLSGRISS